MWKCCPPAMKCCMVKSLIPMRPWLADFFFNQGLPLTRRNTVGDDLDALVAILRERSEQADVLIVNGGLGQPATT
ncbi:competence/damage-inducible protein CinA [Klebsiella pneumoniae]|uniref:Competence/damage-inducible protein CinA n=1 Tax=Klebsiella pneumoniae TaxID=573 RepID=A0A377TZT0_KLEPN|nr:competence/damage-inducible protein CinA [Klebsiella pneumoniae]